MDSDIDIARAANPMHIENIANQLGLSRSDLIMHGPNVAKVSWNSLKNKSKKMFENMKCFSKGNHDECRVLFTDQLHQS